MTSMKTYSSFFDAFLEKLQQTNLLSLRGLPENFLPWFFLQTRLQRPQGALVIVVSKVREFSAWVQLFEDNARLFKDHNFIVDQMPHYSVWGADRYVNQNQLQAQRIGSLVHLKEKKNPIILTTMAALAQRTISPDVLATSLIHLAKGQEWELDQLEEKLRDLGFQRTESIDEVGQFSIRGGIVDIFSPANLHPVRIEFFGDEIRSLRFFSLDTQRSVSTIEEVTLAPARESFAPLGQRKKDAQHLYDYLLQLDMDQHEREGMVDAFQDGLLFPGFQIFQPLFRANENFSAQYLSENDLLFFPGSYGASLTSFEEYFEKLKDNFQQDVDAKRGSMPPDMHFASAPDLGKYLLERGHLISVGEPLTQRSWEDLSLALHQEERLSENLKNESLRFDHWMGQVQKLLAEGGKTVLLAPQEDQLKRLASLLEHRNIYAARDDEILKKVLGGSIPENSVTLGRGSFTSPFYLSEKKLLTLSEQVLFGTKKRLPQGSTKLKNYLSSFKDLKVGSLVVHLEHGICRYLGLTTLKVGVGDADFLHLEFSGGDKLYLPVDKLGVLQRYNSGSEQRVNPSLDKLRGQNWEKRKGRVRKAVKDIAADLIATQAKRKLAVGHQYSAPGEMYYRFEAEFPYEETPDQLKAIEDVNTDLSAQNPMDRLLCGDVGFGKTEVALRAAMRSVVDGYQVLVLVPTTVLCHQHFRTFKNRMEGFGLRVAQANRFVKPQELKKTLEDLSAGKVDVLIGTHRILSKDVKPRRLGLLIIDEEQRFGVEHKEKLKAFAHGVDILTLSATPIPRTLHMSLLGLKDISLITTPPKERLSIKTYVAPFEEDLIKNALEQELRRGGQIFFLHNRVEDIAEVCNHISRLVPHAEARVAHGQMPAHELEKVIIDFLEQKFPILVCTTIIESGIDMPNVNTLIVNHADRFGLSQLYQIRGRVGRSRQQAYAYFLVPNAASLHGDARKRLELLATHQELGEGFHIANYDLEMRGAGNLVGSSQSGQMAEIGVELYTEMLEKAIREMQGQVVAEKIDTEIKLPVSATIPPDYIQNENYRLMVYKNLFSAAGETELDEIAKDLQDRFGEVPLATLRLLKVARLKILLRICQAQSITSKSAKEFEVRFHSLRETQIAKIIEVVSEKPHAYKLTPDYRLNIFLDRKEHFHDDQQVNMLEALISRLHPLAQDMEVFAKNE